MLGTGTSIEHTLVRSPCRLSVGEVNTSPAGPCRQPTPAGCGPLHFVWHEGLVGKEMAVVVVVVLAVDGSASGPSVATA